jgi:excisionase family DNA binding protein
MAMVSVAEAARRLGVGVPRIHQRIRDGSLRAERMGSQWVVDELSLLRAAEHKDPGRRWSARSAWALIALSVGDQQVLEMLAAAERSRARSRLRALLSPVEQAPRSEASVREVAASLRLRFGNRAVALAQRGAPSDVDALREDPRWRALVRPAASGIGSRDVFGYLHPEDVAGVERDYLLVPARGDDPGNVLIRVLPDGQHAYPDSALRLAADLADQRGPREERRAVELLGEVAADWRAGR